MFKEDQKQGTILIIDDDVASFYNEIVRELVKSYKLQTFISKEEVIIYNEVISPKLALVDLNLRRDHDGIEVIDYLNEVYPNLPVIVVTSEDVGSTILKVLKKDNVEDVLLKGSYDLEAWLTIINNTLGVNRKIKDLLEKLDNINISERERMRVYRDFLISNSKFPHDYGDYRILLLKKTEPIQLIENIDTELYLDKVITKKALFFEDVNWQLSKRVNILLGKNGYGKTLLLRLLLLIAHQDIDTILEEGSLDNSFEFDLHYYRENDSKSLIIQKREVFYSEKGRIPILAIGALRFFPRNNSDSDTLSLNERESLYFNGSLSFREAKREIERSETLFKLLVKKYREHRTERFKKGINEKINLLEVPVFKLTQDLINELTQLNFEYCEITDPDDPSVVSAGLYEENLAIMVKTDQHNEQISLTKMSMGTQSVLYLFTTIYSYLEVLHYERKHGDGIKHEKVEYEHAIVFIDEVDAHLHPDWQQKIVWLLRRNFPNVQFVLTAHSPLIVSGCLEGEVAILRQWEPGKFNIETFENSFVGWDVKQLLNIVYNVEEKDETYRHYNFMSMMEDAVLKKIVELTNKENKSESEQLKLREYRFALEQFLYLKMRTEEG